MVETWHWDGGQVCTSDGLFVDFEDEVIGKQVVADHESARLVARYADALARLLKVTQWDGYPRHGSNVELWFPDPTEFFAAYEQAEALNPEQQDTTEGK